MSENQTTAADEPAITMNGLRLIRLSEVRKLTGLSRSTIFRLIDAGQFPAAVQLAPRAIAWRLAEVAAFIEQRQRVARVSAE